MPCRCVPGAFLSPSEVEADARAIAELYAQRGRSAAEVTPQILPRGDNRVDLAFVVREGDVVEIERLSFVGNRAFSSYRLRNVLNTKQAGILRRLVQRDTFVAERVALDRQLLSDFYLARGYIDFEILSVTPELSRERDRFFLTFNLREGEQFRFGDISVVSEVEGVDAADYERELRVRSGDIFAPNTLEMSIARMESLAESRGLRFIRAEPRFDRDNANRLVNVEFAIVRGERVFVERIDIQGNTSTRDDVIRRQFPSCRRRPFEPAQNPRSCRTHPCLGLFFLNPLSSRAQGPRPIRRLSMSRLRKPPPGRWAFRPAMAQIRGSALAFPFRNRTS